MANQKAEIIISAKDQTKIAFASVKNSLGGIGGIASGLNGSLGVLAPLLGAASFTSFLKSGIDTLDMLGDLSDRTGVAASTLSGFQLVAAQSDTSLEALGKGINKLSIFMAENGEEAKRLGLSAKEPAEAFIQLAGIISNIEDPQQRAAVANKVLGKSYQELLPALLQGDAALRKQIETGKEFSGVTEENVKKAQQFNDQLDLFKTKLSNASVIVASDLLPALNEITTNFIENNKRAGIFLATLATIGNAIKIAAVGTDQENLVQRQLELIERIGVAEKRNAETSDQGNKKARENARRKLIDMRTELADVTKQLEDTYAIENPKSLKTTETGTNPTGNTSSTGTSKRDADADAAKRFVESLKKEVETLNLSKTAMLEYEASHLKLNATQKQAVEGLIEKLAVQEKITQANKDQVEADEERRQIIAETVRSQVEFNAEAERVKDIVDPTRAYSREIERLNEFYKAGRISAEEFAKAKALAQDGMSSFVKNNKTEFEELKNAIDGFSRDATNSLVEFAFGASASFEQMANDFAKAVAKMIVQRQLMEPIFNSIGLGVSSSGSGNILGGLFGGLFGGSADVAPSASYGGILGMEGASSGGFGDWLKNLIPSFDVGTDYVPHDMLAMIHKGEKIVPAAQNNGSANGFGNVSINFALNAPVDNRAQQMIAANVYGVMRRSAMRNT
jgi:hypothetical protein